MRLILERREIEGPTGPMKLVVLRPAKPVGPVPGILWIHGGGYAGGSAGMVRGSRARDAARRFGAVVVSPEYRLSRKSPWPAALDDCYAALLWLAAHAGELGVRDDQLFVGGESAGGGLAAAVCMRARDRGDVNIAFQMPLYPMLDCFDTPSSRDNHGHVWNTRRNRKAWKLYLRGIPKGAEIPPEASPARQTDYRNLPPCYTFVCTGEPFFDETRAYVANLQAAGVPAALDIYPGKTHGFDALPFHPWRRRAIETFLRAYRDAAARCFRPQPAAGEGEASR